MNVGATVVKLKKFLYIYIYIFSPQGSPFMQKIGSVIFKNKKHFAQKSFIDLTNRISRAVYFILIT